MQRSVLFAAFLAVSAVSAQAETIGTVQQALGEQCSIITNYIEGSDGGCGGDASAGSVKVSVLAGLEGNKSYNILIDAIDSADVTHPVYTANGVVFSRDDNYSLNGHIYTLPGFGRYQFNLHVINAATGTQVCGAQSLVTAAH